MKKKNTEYKVVTWHNYRYDINKSTEKNSGELLTVPDEAYTIPEIFEKFRRGLSLPLEREVYYSDSDNFDEVDLRQIAKDPYDIDSDMVLHKINQDRRVILGDGLPEQNQTPKRSEAESGVKDPGNNLSVTG